MKEKQLNILLADDDVDDCMFFEEALRESLMYVHLLVVHDGEKLMEILENETNPLPDVLFLDLNMPRKNGFECLREIKQNTKLKALPVVVFSTSYEQEVVNSLYTNGAHYFIRKPAEFSQFRKIILHTLTMIIGYIPTGEARNAGQPDKENFVIT